MDLQLKGKKAIVTGGSAGIGLAVARILAEEGVEVIVPGRNTTKLEAALASLPRHGRRQRSGQPRRLLGETARRRYEPRRHPGRGRHLAWHLVTLACWCQ
jgi:NAD(P)-dependent dehydrogenase (short-subunit alcohol dehydrogenase family)